MNDRVAVWAVATFLVSAWFPVSAQDQIPEESGFSGFANLGGIYFNVASNMIVGGPTFDDVGDPRINSIFEAPSANTSPGVFGGGEINYTFSSTRTQLFFGNRLEDLLRLDLVFGLGVRQQAGRAGIFAVSALATPFEVELWADPYIEGEDRVPTDLDFPGFRIRWGEVFGTGLELTVTDRFYKFDEEASGDWLISQARLDPDEQPLLVRDGDILRVQALYRINVKRHRFEPAIRWVDDDHDGAAIANDGFSAQLTYLWISPKVRLAANVIYGVREAKATNPIYGKVLESDRWATGLSAFIPVKRYTSSVLNVMIGAETFRENANIAFFDSSAEMVFAGMLWRHIKK